MGKAKWKYLNLFAAILLIFVAVMIIVKIATLGGLEAYIDYLYSYKKDTLEFYAFCYILFLLFLSLANIYFYASED